jgi:CRISPR-associated protein Cas1
MMPFIPLKPIPMKERISMIFIWYGQIDVKDGAFVVIDKTGIRKHIPVGSVACIMLEPGTRVSHAAVRLAAQVGTLLVWVGEAGVRLYASGQPGGARSDRLLYQAKLALDDDLRLKVVRKMYEIRFGEPAPAKRSIEQLRGIEGARVRKTYELLAKRYGVKWKGRRYDPKDWAKGDTVNQCTVLLPPVFMGLPKPPCSQQDTHLRLGLFIVESHCLLFTILPTFLSLILWCRKPLK